MARVPEQPEGQPGVTVDQLPGCLDRHRCPLVTPCPHYLRSRECSPWCRHVYERMYEKKRDVYLSNLITFTCSHTHIYSLIQLWCIWFCNANKKLWTVHKECIYRLSYSVCFSRAEPRGFSHTALLTCHALDAHLSHFPTLHSKYLYIWLALLCHRCLWLRINRYGGLDVLVSFVDNMIKLNWLQRESNLCRLYSRQGSTLRTVL